MKKLIISIIILKYLLVFKCLNAQISIHDTDVMKFHSDYKMNYDNMPSGIDVSKSGGNHFWDLSSLNVTHSDTFKIIPMGSSPIGYALPGNRILMKTNDDGHYEFYSVYSDMLTSHGYVAFQSMKVQNKPAEVQLKFPAVYGQKHQGEYRNDYTYYVGEDLSTGYIVDSMRHRTGISYHYEIDGWGTVKTPSGTYNVLRQKITFKTTDTVDVLRQDLHQWVADFDMTEELETRYVFWSDEAYLPVAILHDYGNTDTIHEASWMHNNHTSAITEVTASIQLKIFPNPATDALYVENNSAETKEISIIDAAGKQMFKGSIHSGVTCIDISTFPKGVYVLLIPNNAFIRPMMWVKQ